MSLPRPGLLPLCYCRAFSPRQPRAQPKPICPLPISVPNWPRPDPPAISCWAPDKAPVTIIEYVFIPRAGLRALLRDDFSGIEEAVHRHRQGTLHLPRVSLRQGRGGRLHAGRAAPARTAAATDTWRWWRRYSQSRTNGSKPTIPLEPLENIAKQLGFSDASFKACLTNQQVHQRHRGRAQPRRRPSSASIPRRLSSSTARRSWATCRSRPWPRKSTPISRRIRVFRIPAGCAGRPGLRPLAGGKMAKVVIVTLLRLRPTRFIVRAYAARRAHGTAMGASIVAVPLTAAPGAGNTIE